MSDALDKAWDRYAILLVRDPVKECWTATVVDSLRESLPDGTPVYEGKNRDDAVNHAVAEIVVRAAASEVLPSVSAQVDALLQSKLWPEESQP